MNRNSSSLIKFISAELLFGIGARKVGGCCAFAAQHHLLAGKAIKDPCILTNPRRSNKRDIEVVYEEAL